MTLPHVLHVLEALPPVLSGNTLRSAKILTHQLRGKVARPSAIVSSRQYVLGDRPSAPMDGIAVETMMPSPAERRLRVFHRWAISRRDLASAIAQAAKSCDIIHVHAGSKIGQAAADAASALNLPLIAEIRFDLAGAVNAQSFKGYARFAEPCLRTLFHAHLSKAAHVVSASHSLHAMLVDHGLSPMRVTTIPNGAAALQTGCRAQIRRQLGMTGDTFLAGSTANMLRYEGLDDLVRAAREISDMHVLLVGDGPEKKALKSLAHTLGVADRIYFPGKVPHETISDYLSAMDVFVIARRDLSVTRFASPLKATEAMAAGRPVIAADVGDLNFLLADGRGRLFEPGNFNALLAALRSHDRSQSCAKSAQTWLLETHQWSDLVTGYREIYEEVLDQ